MVIGVPLAKFAPLLFKVVSKPIVDNLKKEALKHPKWKKKVFLPIARCEFIIACLILEIKTVFNSKSTFAGTKYFICLH